VSRDHPSYPSTANQVQQSQQWILGSPTYHRLSLTVAKPTKLGNFMTAAGYVYLPMSPPETGAPLLDRHNIQLQHRGPQKPLLTVEMRPCQCLLRQVPQALHEGSIAFIQTWDVSTGKPIQQRDDGRSTRALALDICIVQLYNVHHCTT